MTDNKQAVNPAEINTEDIVVCTAVSKNYLAFARVLSKSLREQHPSIRIFVLLVDHLEGAFDPAQEPFEVIEIEDLDNIPDPKNFFFKYKPIELNTAAKPYLFEYLFRKYGFTKLIFLDPDILILDSLKTVWDLLDSHNIVLTPHITEPYDDNLRPDEKHILQSGIFNLGFIAMANTSVTNDFLRWWQKRLYEFCFMDISQGMHVDQNWVNFAPVMFEGVHILKDPAYNIAYWNLHSHGRAMSFEKGKWHVHGKLAVFFHFSGIDLKDLEKISTHQTRFILSSFPNLRPLFELYRDLLLENGYEECRKWRYAYGYFDNGVPITDFIRKSYNSFTKTGGYFSNPFSSSHSQSFFNWLNHSMESEKPGLLYPITHLMAYIYNNRGDIKSAHPQPQGADRMGFSRWFATHGKKDNQLDDAFIPGTQRFKEFSFPTQAPQSGVFAPRQDRPKHSLTPETLRKLPLGVNYAGYFRGEFGVAVAARNYIHALQTTRIPSVLNNIIATNHRNHDATFSDFSDDNPYFINIIHVNADQAERFRDLKGRQYYKDHYNIGFWVWELEKFPAKWLARFENYQEIWVPSEFCRRSIGQVSPIAVTKIKHPILLDEKAIRPNRSKFQIAKDEFSFLFVFDYLSVFERKNPVEMIRAFQKAFGKTDKVCLIVKSINSHSAPEKSAQIHTLSEGYNIRFIDRHLDPEDMLSLMASVDCFVSLHRSEGFGLGMAQSMYIGKPVIATGYSGNMDFMTDENSFLVNFELVELQEDYKPYEKGNMWAEPDFDHAVELMRLVYNDRALAERKAQQAEKDIKNELSPQAIGVEMQARIKQIYEG